MQADIEQRSNSVCISLSTCLTEGLGMGHPKSYFSRFLYHGDFGCFPKILNNVQRRNCWYGYSSRFPMQNSSVCVQFSRRNLTCHFSSVCLSILKYSCTFQTWCKCRGRWGGREEGGRGRKGGREWVGGWVSE